MENSGDLNCAGEYLELAVKEAPEEYNTWSVFSKYNKKCGLKDREINALEKLVNLGASEDFVIKRLFSLYLEKNLYDKAHTLLGSIKNIEISLYPDLLKLGNNCFAEGNLEYALQCYMKAVEIKPESSEAWSILSEITLSLGKYDDSQAFLEKALAINGNDLPNLLTMCELKLKTGDIESHVKYCDKILENLSLDRNRTIDSFEDMKNIFKEIGNSISNGITCSSKINNIIRQLDTYMTPAS
jgi:tetratricopeptide (TPR) repeat protein